MSSNDYFERVADRWDEMRSGFFSENVRESAYKAAGIQSGRLAADIGAGTGFVTEGFDFCGKWHQEIGPHWFISEGMLSENEDFRCQCSGVSN